MKHASSLFIALATGMLITSSLAAMESDQSKVATECGDREIIHAKAESDQTSETQNAAGALLEQAFNKMTPGQQLDFTLELSSQLGLVMNLLKARISQVAKEETANNNKIPDQLAVAQEVSGQPAIPEAYAPQTAQEAPAETHPSRDAFVKK